MGRASRTARGAGVLALCVAGLVLLPWWALKALRGR